MDGLTFATFTQMTPALQEAGGLANAIKGSLMMVGLATLDWHPVGVMAGVYLAEYGQGGWLGSVTRFINDILLSAPSIVIGLFVYSTVVARSKTFLRLGGCIGLGFDRGACIICTTENMLVWFPKCCAKPPMHWVHQVASGTITLKSARQV